MKEISVNLRRIPILFYILSILICFIFILLSTAYFDDNPSNNQSMILYILKGNHSLSVLSLWHNTLSSSDMNTWLLILTPLICCIGYVYSFCIDISSKCCIFSMNRQGFTKFIVYRFIGCGLYSAFIMISAMFLSFFTALICCHDIGNVSEAPIAYIIFHKQSALIAILEVSITYICYSFFIGIICITIAAIVLNAFTSCSILVLTLFLCGDIQSSYNSRFLRKMFSGETSPDNYNHFYDLLYVGNVAHGMQNFQSDFHMPYLIYPVTMIIMILLMYCIFYFAMKKRLIL